jgi:hypothetical protein
LYAVTTFAFILVFWWPLAKGTRMPQIIGELACLTAIPLIVYFVGLASISNIGAMGCPL